MEYVTKEQITIARKTNLYDFLCQKHPDCIRIEGQSIRLLPNNSISIKRGYSGYHDFSTQESGNSIDFLVRHMGYSFTHAVQALYDSNLFVCQEITSNVDLPLNYHIQLPPKSNTYKHAFSYLMHRGIPSSLIQTLIRRKLLYQSNNYNNLVFINTDRDWAELRGTNNYCNRPFHGIAPGSRSDGFWIFSNSISPDTTYICESAVDALSLFLLHQKASFPVNTSYCSIAGVSKQSTINRIKKIMPAVLAVDNDIAGDRCRHNNPDLPFIIPRTKDWNEDLMTFT